MPRRDFIRDLQEACISGACPQLKNVRPGDDDGVISFTYVAPQSPGTSVDIQLLVPDISSYPREHEFFVYSTSDDVPRAVSEKLEEAQSSLSGLRVVDVLGRLTTVLKSALLVNEDTTGHDNDHDVDVDMEMDSDADIPDGLGYSDDEDAWSPQSPRATTSFSEPSHNALDGDMVAKLGEDLRLAKLAGFRVGYLGNPNNPIVCISCRIGALGISEEAMQAWKVDARQYLVCMIRYLGRYRSLSQIVQEEAGQGKSSIDIHVDLCDSYKPGIQDALLALNPNYKNVDSTSGSTTDQSKKARKMTKSFISRPLNALLNERFTKILSYRYNLGLSWSGAEVFFNDIQGKSINHADPGDPKYLKAETQASDYSTLSELVVSDHLVEKSGFSASFPLIAMQFTLRHFVRCTEFCLVCHCKTEDTFEALKPYVCSKSLCLYQYMSLGFGPSLEWEIISQPYVVDLLISFTYLSARGNRLNDFPTGLGILVPSEISKTALSNSGRPQSADYKGEGCHKAKLDFHKQDLLFDKDYPTRPVRPGDWIVVVRHPFSTDEMHYRVQDTSFWPSVSLSKPVIRKIRTGTPKDDYNKFVGFQNVGFLVYDKNFDEMEIDHKRLAITLLLDTLPSVTEMVSFLMDTSQQGERTLANWNDRISKSALDVLRWIVASNRSCIIQENQANGAADSKGSLPSQNDEDRVFGLNTYMQFRFAQGAPDKEQRFIQAVDSVAAKTNTKYPTIFAWHGSSLSNWHGIVREGLHFKDVMHGRAFGNGVYMSPHFATSVGYTGGNYGEHSSWPQSVLKISSAISLNEVVNAPNQFVSKNPHFVVSQLDWIQPRYLFVSCQATEFRTANDKATEKPTQYFQQDPQYTAIGPDGQHIIIPVTAVSQRRRATISIGYNTKPVGSTIADSVQEAFTSLTTVKPTTLAPAPPKPAKKRLKLFGLGGRNSAKEKILEDAVVKESTPVEDGDQGSARVRESLIDDDLSEETDEEDLLILVESDKNKGKEPIRDPSQAATKIHDPAKTDFVPGTLVASTLPLLAPPSFATPSATKALQRDLKTTLQIQDTHPGHELGWYIDPNLVNTVYQWIVELHSFEKDLPISKDLKAAGLKSVVLELRFPKEYPHAPPFVRVIRPRFLNFMRGGGGHITAGGALCMELLTNSGWSAVSSIESVLLQVRMAMSTTEPYPAKLEPGQSVSKGTVLEYGVREAVDAYLRVCRMHGWEVPQDFERASRERWDLAKDP